jgi:hypothetical protein
MLQNDYGSSGGQKRQLQADDQGHMAFAWGWASLAHQ